MKTFGSRDMTSQEVARPGWMEANDTGQWWSLVVLD